MILFAAESMIGNPVQSYGLAETGLTKEQLIIYNVT
jgi:hypothetical protein